MNPSSIASLFWISGWGFPAAALDPLRGRLGEAPAVDLAGLPAPFAESLRSRLAAGRAPATLVGWSIGGLLAMETAIAEPGRVRALVLISSTARFCADDGYPAGAPTPVVRGLIQEWKGQREVILADFFRRCRQPDRLGPDELNAAVAAARHFEPETLRDGLRYLLETDLRARLNEVACPTLILHGTDDQIIPGLAAFYLHQAIPNNRLVTYDGAGHDLPIRRPDEVSAEIRSFLETCP
jgi:pimeloyl-[acyl-carrier protein] methyl ester esterase